MTTIAEIARMAGVAKSTVSRFLNGGSVSDETKQKIQRIIDETHYAPNTFAQSLKAKKTTMIGTIVPRLDSYAASRTIMGIDRRLRERHYQMIVLNTDQDQQREIESIYTLAKQKVAGIILLATRITDAHLKAFASISIPVLLVGQQHPDVHSVIHSDKEASAHMAIHILKQGHKKIAFLGVGVFDESVGVHRKKGFLRAVDEWSDPVETACFETTFSMEQAERTASQLIEQFAPTAIMCATDNIAIGAAKAAYSLGLRIPEDISITGFGGYDVTAMMAPPLTTVRIHFLEAGQTAADHIVGLIEQKPVPKQTFSTFELLLRESVDKRA